MKKTKLVIASILKPVDDTRMFEKFGVSLSQTNEYDINIIGFQSKNLPTYKNITFHSLFSFNRLSLKRIYAPWKILFLLLKLKPEVLIVNTHELLIVSFLYKILFGVKLYYDIRENYFRNILYTQSFPKILRPLVAVYVRAKEYLSYSFIDHYFLAEQGYEREFSFVRNNFTIIENKFKPFKTPEINRPGDSMTILFSGTVAESTGIFEVINLVSQLHQRDNRIKLIIKGYCAFGKIRKQLYDLCDKHEYILTDDLSSLTSHEEIENAIAHSNFGIIYYPQNKSTINCKPTKLFEYIGMQLPILLHNHQPWLALANTYQAAIPINFISPDIDGILDKMYHRSFYPHGIDNAIFWSQEEKKLIERLAQ